MTEMKIYKNVDDYRAAEFGSARGATARMCEYWGVALTVKAQWFNSGFWFIVEGERHRRVKVLASKG